MTARKKKPQRNRGKMGGPRLESPELDAALRDVLAGRLSIREAAQKHGLAEQERTLRRRVDEAQAAQAPAGEPAPPSPASDPTATPPAPSGAAVAPATGIPEATPPGPARPMAAGQLADLARLVARLPLPQQEELVDGLPFTGLLRDAVARGLAGHPDAAAAVAEQLRGVQV